jgi:methyltransferase family protein
VIEAEDVARALHALFIAVAGTQLRQEDRKKAIEVAAFLTELERRVGRGRLVVDAAAGKAYVGLLATLLLGVERLHVIERNPLQAEAARIALDRAASWSPAGPAATVPAAGRARPDVRIVLGDVADPASWPARPDVVAALHACGPASDAILVAAAAAQARWILLVPCCYAASVPFTQSAIAIADRLCLPEQAEVRRRFVMSLIDAERTLRLEAAGYEVTIGAFVPPTVTPHNLLWRARRVGEPRRMADAAARLARLRAGIPDAVP